MKISETKIENHYTIYPGHLNRHNTLFGGQILYWLDEVMGISIRKYSKVPFVTATIDNYQFLDAVKVNEFLMIKSYVSRVGNKSVEVFAELSAYDINTQEVRIVGICTSTFATRRDVILEQPLESLEEAETELENYVVTSYNARKNGELTAREFAKQYVDLYNKEKN